MLQGRIAEKGCQGRAHWTKGESGRTKGGPPPENQGGVQGPTHPPCRRGSDVADVAVDVVYFGFFAYNSPETRFVAVNHRRESSIFDDVA